MTRLKEHADLCGMAVAVVVALAVAVHGGGGGDDMAKGALGMSVVVFVADGGCASTIRALRAGRTVQKHRCSDGEGDS